MLKNMKNRPEEFIKICRICGAVAAGFGYSGLCCNPCKLFFFRNAHNIKKLHCTKGEKCKIVSTKRKACPKCRLIKCFEIGMKPKASQTKSSTSTKLNTSSTIEDNSGNLRLILETDNKDIVSLSPVRSPSSCTALTRKKNSLTLVSYEREIIHNIQSVLSGAFVNETGLKIAGNITTVAEAFNTNAMYAKSIVKFCKNIPAFKQLNDADQLIVLKPFYYELMMVRLSFLWDLDKLEFPVIENESASQALVINSDLGSKFKNQDLIEENRLFQLSLNRELEKDFTIRDLLIALLMYHPRKNLTCPEFIRYKYYVHCHLLKRYLEDKYGNRQVASRKHSSLLRLSQQFDRARENTRQLLLTEIDFQEISQILVEIFNLN